MVLVSRVSFGDRWYHLAPLALSVRQWHQIYATDAKLAPQTPNQRQWRQVWRHWRQVTPSDTKWRQVMPIDAKIRNMTPFEFS